MPKTLQHGVGILVGKDTIPYPAPENDSLLVGMIYMTGTFWDQITSTCRCAGRGKTPRESQTVSLPWEQHLNLRFCLPAMESLNLSTTNRKIRKPLMERKRRARINQSLSELQQLLAETEFTSKGTKLEKADILEMTVQYLKHVKESECDKENLENLMMERYLLGFGRCAEEIGAFVAESPGVDVHLRHRIATHLKNCMEKVRHGKTSLGADREVQVPWNGGSSCSVLLQGSKDFRILPSKLPNGDVILFLSSNVAKCGEGLTKSDVWRPWW